MGSNSEIIEAAEVDMKLPSWRSMAQRSLNKVGYRIVPVERSRDLPHDIEPEFEEMYQRTRPYTLTNMLRMYALYKAVEYVVSSPIPGDIVECGVWKGGSSMMAASTLLKNGDSARRLWLYDTYTGMTEPAENDIRATDGTPAVSLWQEYQQKDGSQWMSMPLEEARVNMLSTGYPEKNISFVEGRVEDTIPNSIPGRIALLRLDTDWYESTYHELNHLFPRLSPHGVLIIDDYGWWKGAKQATDQYFEENNIQILLNRIDSSGRMGLKMGAST